MAALRPRALLPGEEGRGHGPPRRPVAFYAPMKPPDHPIPSGDREIARALIAALTQVGMAPETVSRLRSLDMAGDPAAQAAIRAEAEAEALRLTRAFCADPPAAWLTYHCYYKAPDLLGPAVSRALGLPYLIVEPSISPKRREGAWGGFARASEAAIAAADRLFWTTERDRPALEAAGLGARMTHLPAFLEPGPRVAPRPAGTPLRLLAVAMMRPGDKAESYARLAAALPHLELPWTLGVIGDGPASGAVAAGFAAISDRVTWLGALDGPAAARPRLAAADLMVWPGVNEGVGMVWLEAQAAGCPVVAEDGPAARAVVHGGVLAPPGEPRAFAAAIARAAADRARLSAKGRAGVERHHGAAAAGRALAAALAECAP